MDSPHFPLASYSQRCSTPSRQLFSRGWWRRVLCLGIICGMLIVPDAGYAVSAVTEVAVKVAKDTVAPLPESIAWLRRLFHPVAAPPQQETTAERNARVQHVRLSPGRFVGYIGETVTFVAMGLDDSGQPAHGAKFDWSTDDTRKVQIDDAGRATLLRPGLARINCRVGTAEATARLLIRPTRRPLQTDEQWRIDQDDLRADPTDGIGLLTAPAALLEKLLPAVQAQTNSPGDYGNLAQIVGSPTFTPKEPTRLGSVLSTGNFELALPLVDLGGRGLATTLNLYYNSNLWTPTYDQLQQRVYFFDPIQSWPSPGFSLGFGRIVYYNGYTDPNLVSWHTFMLVDADGTRHALGTGQDYGNNTLQTTDGSHITYVGNAANGGTLYYQDGTAVIIGKVNNRLLPTMIIDTNGNYIQIAYKWETNFPGIALNYIVDTLGRVIQFNYNAYNSTNLTSISGPTGTVSFNYQTVTMNASFYDDNGNQAATQNMPTTFPGLSSLTIPARPQYQFSYSGYGMIYQVTGTSGGGTGTMMFNYPLGGEGVWGGPTFSQRTESGTNSPTGVFTYGVNGISRPDGSVFFLSSAMQQVKSSTGTVLSEMDYTYTTDPGGSTVVQSIVTTDDGTPANQAKVDFDYDQYGNVVNKREYGLKVSGQWQVRRRTHYSYVNWEPYLSAYIRNRITETDVYDALLNINDTDDVLIGKTVAAYDNYGAMGGMESYGGAANPPGHLTTYGATMTTRGNLTGVTTYPELAGGGVSRNQKRDIFGNTTVAQVSCCSQKTFYCDGHTDWARPCTITSGNPADKCLTTIQSYNFNTLDVTGMTNANNQTISYGYDAASRPVATTSPTGASASITYNGWGRKTSTSITYNEGGVNKTLSETVVYDGWGQKTQSVDANGAQINYTYDAMGRLLTQTNPFPHGTTPGPVTTYQYDLLGRTTRVTLPGGNTTQTTYSGNIITVIDQVNRKRQRISDGLGRLVTVNEQDASGNLTLATNYSYDCLDNLTQVNQGNQLRRYQYDASSRLTAEKIPERGDPTQASQWTTTYTYTDFNAVATRTDARGVITTYAYDTLRRLTNASYNTSNAPGVAATPSVTFTYGNTGVCDPSDHTATGVTKGLLLSVSVGTAYSESYAYDSNKRVQAVTRTMDGKNYTTSYTYDTANQMTQIVYPASTRVVNISHDSLGRLSAVADQYQTYAGSFIYDGIGRLTSYSRGNGLAESFGYDPTRMHMASQTATLGGNTLMSLAYNYTATSAGQFGVGTTPGDPGQLLSVGGTINGTTESASYTYDDDGRLVTANQTSNGTSAQRRFAYDRWGNRTGVWDAVSGGSQIQSVSLQTVAFPGTGSAPTNRIASVTATGTVSYLYDANGNVINDGAHAYDYDGENRLVSVDGGKTASYSYDHQNQRYKKVAGAAGTHYIWQGGEVIAEHDASSGAALMNYMWAGGKLLASLGGGVLKWMVSDRLSTRLVIDANGNVIGRQGHLAYGEDFAESGTQQKQHFTTYDRDAESGLDYAVNRYYGSSVGRYTSVDPYSASSDLSNPQSLNRYAYAEDEPVNRTDPLGLDPWSIIDLGNGRTAIRTCFSIGENSWCEWRVITEYEPRGKEPKPCEGHHKAPLQGKRLDKYDAKRDIVRDKLQNSDQCKKYLSDHGIDPGAALDAVNLQHAYDGEKSDISLAEAGLERPSIDSDSDAIKRNANACVSARFKYLGKRLRAETAIWPEGLPSSQTTVADRSDVYFGSDFSAATILHEALHSLFGIEDPGLAAKLNVDISKKGSVAITDELKKNGCGD